MRKDGFRGFRVGMILQALAAYPSVFNSSVLFLNYDENDGLFDHVPPPVAPAGTALEYIPGANSIMVNPSPTTNALPS